MNINISQNRPLIRQLKRIADALDRLAPLPTASDPSGEDDVQFTDEEADYVKEEEEKRSKLRKELEDDVFIESH